MTADELDSLYILVSAAGSDFGAVEESLAELDGVVLYEPLPHSVPLTSALTQTLAIGGTSTASFALIRSVLVEFIRSRRVVITLPTSYGSATFEGPADDASILEKLSNAIQTIELSSGVVGEPFSQQPRQPKPDS